MMTENDKRKLLKIWQEIASKIDTTESGIFFKQGKWYIQPEKWWPPSTAKPTRIKDINVILLILSQWGHKKLDDNNKKDRLLTVKTTDDGELGSFSEHIMDERDYNDGQLVYLARDEKTAEQAIGKAMKAVFSPESQKLGHYIVIDSTGRATHERVKK